MKMRVFSSKADIRAHGGSNMEMLVVAGLSRLCPHPRGDNGCDRVYAAVNHL